MTIEDLKTFVFVAATESLSKSAKVLNQTESALSTSIKRTKNELGYKLFDRPFCDVIPSILTL